MLRLTLIELALFLAPFATFALYLILRGRPVFARHVWEKGALFWLVLAGLAAAALGVAGLGVVHDGATTGAWRPAHFENGVLVPGRVE